MANFNVVELFISYNSSRDMFSNTLIIHCCYNAVLTVVTFIHLGSANDS